MTHDKQTVLTIYSETRRPFGCISAADGQLIPVSLVFVKVRCECGRISLEELLFPDEPAAK